MCFQKVDEEFSTYRNRPFLAPPFLTALPAPPQPQPPLTFLARWPWADGGWGHPLADENLQADVLRGGGVPPLLCIFW